MFQQVRRTQWIMATNQNSNKTEDAKKTRKSTAAKAPAGAKPTSVKTTTAKKTAAKKAAPAKTTAKTTTKTTAASKKPAAKKSAPAKRKAPVAPAAVKTAPAKSNESANTDDGFNRDPFKEDNEARIALLSNLNAPAKKESTAEVFTDNASTTAHKKIDWAKIGIAAAGVIIGIIILIFCIRGCVSAQSSTAAKERDNTIQLAQNYIDRGLYDEALGLLNGLLIKNPDDTKAQELMMDAAEKKKKADLANGGTSGDYSVNIDTSNIADAMQSSLNTMQSQLEKQQEANAKTTQELNDLLKKQQEQANNDKAEQAERKAQEEAAAKQRAADEAKRKEEEAELAKKDAALKKLMESVDEEIKQGEGAINSGDVNGALNHFNKAKNLLPDGNSDSEKKYSSLKLGQMARDMYDASSAVGMESDPNKATLEKNAVSYAGDSIAKYTHCGPSHYVIGMIAFGNKKFSDAEKELQLAVAEEPRNYEYYYQLGRAQARQNENEKARSSFNSSIIYNNKFALSQYNLGVVLDRLGMPSDALKAYRNAYEIDKNYEKAYLGAANILQYKKDYSGAISAYKEAIRINPENADTYKKRGKAYSDEGDYKNAETDFRKALSMLNPNEEDPQTNYNLSTVLFNLDKPDEALKYAKKAYDTRMSSSDKKVQVYSIYNYGLMREKTGDTDGAIKMYTEVLKEDSKNVKAKVNLANIYLEQNDSDGSYTDSAIKLLNSAYDTDKNNFEVDNSLGSAYLKKKDYDSAITYLQAALKIDPTNTVARMNLAKAFASAGQYDNAKVTYQDVIKKDKSNWDAYIELAKVCITQKDNDTALGNLLYVQKNRPDYRTSEVKNLIDSISASEIPEK